MTKAQIKSAISGCPLFSGCAFGEDSLIAQSFKRGETVLDTLNGEPVIGVIAKGKVGVYSVSPDQSEVNLSSLGAGEAFGISNLFSSKGLDTRLVCLERTDVVFVPKQAFVDMMSSNSALAERYMTLLNSKIRFLIQRIELLTSQSGRAKLAEYLLTNANSENSVLLGCSKEQLAKLLGMSRAALFREIATLTQERLISVDKNRITLLDRSAVAKLLKN